MGDHAFGIVDLEEVASLIAGVGGASMPDFAAEDDDITGIAHDGFFGMTFPFFVVIGAATGEVAAGDDAEAAVCFCGARKVVHKFDIVEFGVAVPEEGAVGGEFVDAPVSKIDIIVAFELTNEFDDFGVKFDL